MKHVPNLDTNVTLSGWGFIGKVVLVVITMVGAFALWGCFNSQDSDRDSPKPQRRTPVNSPEAGPSASSINIGDTKRIRVGAPTKRSDMPVFIPKEALMRFLRAASKNDSAGMIATLSDTFPVTDYTPVRVIGYDPIGNGLFNIEILEGRQKSRTGWVLDIDLRDP